MSSGMWVNGRYVDNSNTEKRFKNLLQSLIITGDPESIEYSINRLLQEEQCLRKELIKGIYFALIDLTYPELYKIKITTLEYLAKTLGVDEVVSEKLTLAPFYLGFVIMANLRVMSVLLKQCGLDIKRYVDYCMEREPNLLISVFLPGRFITNDEEGYYPMFRGSEQPEKNYAKKRIICQMPFWHTEDKIIWIAFYKPQPPENFISLLPKDIIKLVLEELYLLRVCEMTKMLEDHPATHQLAEMSKKKIKLV
jgi:hypothetical protein